jgi:hypothetical protein
MAVLRISIILAMGLENSILPCSEIIQRLMIGSEGTLGFVSQATYNTVPEWPHKASAFILFPHIKGACSAAAALRETSVDAVELFDYASLKWVPMNPLVCLSSHSCVYHLPIRVFVICPSMCLPPARACVYPPAGHPSARPHHSPAILECALHACCATVCLSD